MDLSVIIVSYNVRYFLEQCILSVLAASKNIQTEIIVVDNNSTDDTCEIIQNNYTEITLIKNKENVGFSTANNQGVAIAKGKYVLILNPDTIVAEDTFDKILNFAISEPKLGILGVKLIDGSGKFLRESKRAIPTPLVAFKKLFGNSKTGSTYYASFLNENQSGSVAILVGAFMFLKKEVYNKLNGFDSSFFMYGEDIDFSLRALKKGFVNYYFAQTQVIHFKGESTQKNTVYLTYFKRAMQLFYAKHFKKNRLYNAVMQFGMEAWYWQKFFRLKFGKIKPKSSNRILYLGLNNQVYSYLSIKYIHVNSCSIIDVREIENTIISDKIDTLVFDNELLSNKQVIQFFELFKGYNLVYKIHPKNAHFLISSSCSNAQGNVEFIK
jgi:GT2 family glycosyltransferase